MERSVISRGKTVEQAVERALALLEVNKQEVNIEIIHQESKGLLGFNSRPAVVKVTRISSMSEQNIAVTFVSELTAAGAGSPHLSAAERTLASSAAVSTPSDVSSGSALDNESEYAVLASSIREQESREGLIWIHNGRIHVRSALDGRLPILDAFKSGDITINGEPLTAGQSAPVSEQDQIEITLSEELREPLWQLEIDPDAMTVHLQVEPGSHIQRYLIDTEPEPRLMLRVAQRKEILPIHSDEVESELTKLGVIYGIDQQAIQTAVRSAQSGRFVIARGLAPVPGQDGSFQLNTDTQARKIQPKMREDGTIDYRETREFPSIAEGEVIGTLLPAEPGTEGIDVYGRTIAAPPVRNFQIIAGKDVKLSEDGFQAYALKAGMANQVKQGYHIKLSMVPKLMHSGDVNLATGNIHFQGDVEISGAVQDTMQVDAEGNVHIRGNINMAQIIAGQSLIVNANVISSRIVIGQMNLFYGQVAPMLHYVEEQSELLTAAVRQVSSASAFKVNDMQETGLSPLFQVLFQGRFKWMYEHLQRLIKLGEQYQSVLSEEWERYFTEVKYGFLKSASSHFHNANDLESFTRRTRYLYAVAALPAEHEIFSRFHYIQNSTVNCGGDVVVEKGCYNTHLHCEGRLEASGALRGGTYYAAQGMILKEAGSPGTGSTVLHVGEKGFIRAEKILAGTTVRVGERVHQFNEDVGAIKARVDHDDQFVW